MHKAQYPKEFSGNGGCRKNRNEMTTVWARERKKENQITFIFVRISSSRPLRLMKFKAFSVPDETFAPF